MSRFSILLPPLLLLISVTGRAGEHELSPPPFGSGYAVRTARGYASTPEQSFIVWNDYGAEIKSVASGARIGPGGELLDPAGLRLYTGATESTYAVGVAPAGDDWVTFWTDGAGLYAQRITTGGRFDGSPTLLATADYPAARLAFRSGIVVWNDESALISFNALSWATGAVVVSHDLRSVRTIDLGGAAAFQPVAREDGYAVLTWLHGESSIVRLSNNGEVLSTNDTVSAFAAFAWTGSDYLIAWNHGAGVIRGRRLDANLIPRGEVFEIAQRDADIRVRRILSDEEGAARVIWAHRPDQPDQELAVSAVTAGNQVSAAVTLMKAVPGTLVTRTDGGILIVEASDLTLTTFDPNTFEPVASTTLDVQSFAAQHYLNAIRDGNDDLVVFSQVDPSTTSAIFGKGSEVMISRRDGTAARALFRTGRAQDGAAIAGNGEHALAVWIEPHDERVPSLTPFDLMALPLRADGSPAIAQPLRLGRASFLDWIIRWENPVPERPVVAWTGQLYLVVWRDADHIVYTRLLSDGTVIDYEPITVNETSQRQVDPVLARAGDVTVLIWSEGLQFPCPFLCPPHPAKIQATRFSSAGLPLDAAPISISNEAYAIHPDVATHGDVALVVWQEGGVMGRRIDANGVLQEGALFRVTHPPASRPAVARHEDGFLVVWQKGESNGRAPLPDRLEAVMVTPEGAASGIFSVTDGTGQPEGPFAWTTPSGAAAVGYMRTNAATGMVPRIFYRIMGEPAPLRRRAVGR